jgi:hypothetical protein
MASYNITYTGGGHTLIATITIAATTSTADGFTGYQITSMTGTFDGHTISLLAPGGYGGNNNLFSPTGQAFGLDHGVSFSANGDKIELYDNGTSPNVSYALTDYNGTAIVDSGTLTVGPVCFVSGTLIQTARGEVAVEDLKVGDMAVTASGEARPVIWIGSRTIKRPSREHGPVRVAAGAFGDSRPTRDLTLSPGHAVGVKVMDHVLIPIGKLINGATIARVDVDEVTYWHVELESHDVLMAENLPCESYMDCGNRGWFAGRKGSPDPERIEASLSAYAWPFVDRGPVLTGVRQRLSARAAKLGWRRASGVDPRLVVDGQRVDPDIDGDLARFLFPASAKDVRLVSDTFSPAWTGESPDGRELGVRVKGLHISDGLRVHRETPLDHPALDQGFHKVEREGEAILRWTDGDARLPAELWDDCKGQVILRLSFGSPSGWAWRGPKREAVETPSKVVPIRVA